MLPIHFEQKTDIGRVREENEDCFAVVRSVEGSGTLAVLCDGMGGVAGGSIASRMACDMFGVFPLYRLGTEPYTTASNRRGIESLIHLANEQIYNFGREHPRFAGLGTTASALVFLDHHIVIGHVGDSRIYRLRGERFEQLTPDHTLAAYLSRQGRSNNGDGQNRLGRNILTQAVGAQPKLRDVFTAVDDLMEEDLYLLCSDGLTDLVPDSEIRHILETHPQSKICSRLVDAALSLGGKDNISVVTAGVGPELSALHAA